MIVLRQSQYCSSKHDLDKLVVEVIQVCSKAVTTKYVVVCFVCKYMYSGPSVKGHSLERTPLYKGQKFLAAGTMNVCNAPSHQRTPL